MDEHFIEHEDDLDDDQDDDVPRDAQATARLHNTLGRRCGLRNEVELAGKCAKVEPIREKQGPIGTPSSRIELIGRYGVPTQA